MSLTSRDHPGDQLLLEESPDFQETHVHGSQGPFCGSRPRRIPLREGRARRKSSGDHPPSPPKSQVAAIFAHYAADEIRTPDLPSHVTFSTTAPHTNSCLYSIFFPQISY